MSGVVEIIRVGNVTVRHEVHTSAASCFRSACRARDYDKCTIFSMYPALVPWRQLNVIEEKVIMDSGVEPAGVDVRAGGRRKKRRKLSSRAGSAPVGCRRLRVHSLGNLSAVVRRKRGRAGRVSCR